MFLHLSVRTPVILTPLGGGGIVRVEEGAVVSKCRATGIGPLPLKVGVILAGVSWWLRGRAVIAGLDTMFLDLVLWAPVILTPLGGGGIVRVEEGAVVSKCPATGIGPLPLKVGVIYAGIGWSWAVVAGLDTIILDPPIWTPVSLTPRIGGGIAGVEEGTVVSKRPAVGIGPLPFKVGVIHTL